MKLHVSTQLCTTKSTSCLHHQHPIALRESEKSSKSIDQSASVNILFPHFVTCRSNLRIQEEIKSKYNKDTYINPFPWLDNFQLTLNDFFRRLKIISRRRGEGISMPSNETVDMYQIFQAHDAKQPRTVLIEADPGMGKSMFWENLGKSKFEVRFGQQPTH